MVGPCPEIAALRELRGGELSPDARARLEAHVSGCALCRAVLEGLTREGGPGAPWDAMARGGHLAATADVGDTAVRPATGAGPFGPGADVPARLGHFEVVRLIGRGGMGMVFEGYDTRLERPVALKVLGPARVADPVAQERFCREARAAARVANEHVVAVHQVEHESAAGPFFVMQLVAGESLEARLARGWRPGPEEAARIGLQVAVGLGAAHAEGLAHRDVKPANILLERGTDRVKLTDFGLARAAEDVKLTGTGVVAGTPLYMSPEQAHAAEVDHRGDLFSLGVVLYELCTGEVPWSAPTPLAVMKKLTEDAHRPAREVSADVPAWLSDVIDRLLEKSPDRRYQTAGEVAAALAPPLSGASMVTHVPGVPPPPSGAAAPAARRWRWKLIAAPVLLGGLVLVGLPLLRPRAEPEGAELAPLRALDGQAGPISSVAFTGHGAMLAMGLEAGSVRFWDAGTGRAKATINGAHKGSVWAVAFSRDGRRFATAGDDGAAKLWEGEGPRPAAVLEHRGAVQAVAFSPDGGRVVTGSLDGALRVWSVSSGQEALKLRGHDASVTAVAYSPDGQTIASASSDKSVKLWDAATGVERGPLTGHEGGVYGLAYQPGGRLLATGSWDGTVRLWDADAGAARGVLRGHEQDVWGVAFSPDGRLLASGAEDRTVRLWDVAAAREVATLRGHRRAVYSVAFSPDGRLLATAGRETQALVWDVAALGR